MSTKARAFAGTREYLPRLGGNGRDCHEPPDPDAVLGGGQGQQLRQRLGETAALLRLPGDVYLDEHVLGDAQLPGPAADAGESSPLSTLWIRSQTPTTLFTLFFCRWPMK